MTKNCILCKKESNPFSNRSFHKFPTNNKMRETWIAALNLTKTLTSYKTACICSDHFEKKCFYDSDEFRSRNRLLPSAVPKISTQSNMTSATTGSRNVETDNDCENIHECDNRNKCNNVTENEITKVFVSLVANVAHPNITDQKCTEDLKANNVTNLDLPSQEHSIGVTSNLSSRKRKCLFRTIHIRKQIRFMDGLKTNYITKKDFVSDEAWNRFLRYQAYQQAKLAAAHNRNFRRTRRIKNLQVMIHGLGKKKRI